MPIIKAGDININYKMDGMGEPLVMIMGFGAAMDGWNSQAPFFAKHFKVITFDNRGAGKSDKPKGPYTTAMMAEDTTHLMDSLGIEKAHVMGASMGGLIAQEFAINYPDRVDRLVLACTFARLAMADPEGAKSKDTPEERQKRVISLAYNKPLYRLFHGTLAKVRSIPHDSPEAVGIEGQNAAVSTHDTVDRLTSIRVPTLVIVGSGDRLVSPSASEFLAGKIPNAGLVKIEGGSHVFNVENRDEFNREILKFLTA
jgi:pimeloyl-ACP methyl ester carboxylesterase